MKKKKKNVLTTIWNRIVEFFTEEEKSNQVDFSIKTLIIIFLIGVLIIGSFYLFFGSTKIEYNQYRTDTFKTASNVTNNTDINTYLVRNDTCIENCKVKIDFINDTINNISTDMYSLQSNYANLTMNYEELQYDYAELQNNYSIQIEENSWLQQEINEMNTSLLDLYTKIYPYEYSTTHCEKCFVYLSLINNGNNLMKITYTIPPSNKKKWQVFLHKVKERWLNIPVDYGWVYVYKYLPDVDWSNYSAIKINVKSDIPGGSFQLHFKEQDGDEWFYMDDTILSKDGWISVTIPFTQFSQPSWASHANGKQQLNDITEIGITFTSFDKSLNKTVYFSVNKENIFSLA